MAVIRLYMSWTWTGVQFPPPPPVITFYMGVNRFDRSSKYGDAAYRWSGDIKQDLTHN